MIQDIEVMGLILRLSLSRFRLLRLRFRLEFVVRLRLTTFEIVILTKVGSEIEVDVENVVKRLRFRLIFMRFW